MPGEVVVTEAQKVELTRLRDEWIALHNTLKQRPLTIGGAQKTINDRAGVTSYHRIPAEKFKPLVAWIKRQMGILRNMASAPAKDPAWRTSKIRGIKVHSKKQLGDEFAYVPYIKKNFGKSSLTELATEELQRTHAYIMAKKGPTPVVG